MPGPHLAFLKAIIFASSTLLSPCSYAHVDDTNQQAPRVIKLAAEDNWAPFANASGTGISHSIINSAFSRVGIEVKSIVVPYSRAVVMAKKGLVDGVFNLVKEKSTENHFIFGEQPLFSATASFYQNAKTPVQAVDKWQLPPNTKVGIIQGYEYGDELNLLPNVHIFKLANHNQLINLLLLDRIDLAIMYDLVADQYIQRMGVATAIEKTFTNHTGQVYLAFSKHNPQAETLAKLLDTGLISLQQDGSYQKIMTSIESTNRGKY
ncbi:transporter substrate-binding domain-containing protein [Shewanella sp.]|uniref:substrate-binding periplasmic protein n=1 Tax=Shewanella sp. TaxID=50422 RepID=UPI0025860E0C|nr:transporter substrate-binding domain-containing protein [Shewanella sp.]MCJ8303553.1 transporter substrate-binding domain-containing protein [Shewanella sp.]